MMAARFRLRWVAAYTDAARALFQYHWPLNVRELEKCLARGVALAEEDVIDLEHLPEALLQPQSGPAPEPATADEPGELSDVDQMWRDKVVVALREHSGNVAAASRALGKDRKQIHRWIKRFAIDLTKLRGVEP